MRSFEVKVNRKVRRAALAGALSNHVGNETLALVDGTVFETPSTKQAKALIDEWGKTTPLVVVAHEDEDRADQVVPQPRPRARDGSIRARGGADRLGALGARQRGCAPARRREGIVNPADVLIAPVVSEKSYSGLADRKYTFKVHQDAHKTQVRQAVEQLFGVKVQSVHMIKVAAKPKRRGVFKGVRPSWKKAIVQLREGETIEIFEGAQV